MAEIPLIKQLESLGVRLASQVPQPHEHLRSGHDPLDTFLEGGLPIGAITEIGVTLGLCGRRVVLQFLAAIPGQPILWVYPETALYAFPPTWAAYGVSLKDIGFVRTDYPVRDLKPALLDPLYRVVVLDFPIHLSKDDQAFLARQARTNRTVILVLTNRALKEEKGNVWARLRLNCHRHRQLAHSYEVEVVRGLSPRRRTFLLDQEAGCFDNSADTANTVNADHNYGGYDAES